MISVVTGTYNRRAFLPGLIADVLHGECRDDMELVIVDGGSSDGTEEYLTRAAISEPNLTFIERGRRSSYGDYMNAGIEASSGKWIAQWNDDVVLECGWSKVFDIINRRPEPLIEQEETSAIGDDAPEIHLFARRVNNEAPKIHFNEFFKCLNFGLYSRSVFCDIGMYDEVTFEYYMADADMTHRAHVFGKRFALHDDIVVRELTCEKKAVGPDFDQNLYFKNMRAYKEHRLPAHIRKLI